MQKWVQTLQTYYINAVRFYSEKSQRYRVTTQHIEIYAMKNTAITGRAAALEKKKEYNSC